MNTKVRFANQINTSIVPSNDKSFIKLLFFELWQLPQASPDELSSSYYS